MHPNIMKMHQNMNLGFNGVDRVRSLPKIPMWVRGTNFCINWTSSPRFAPSFMQLRNEPKHYETYQNMSLGSNGVDMERSLWKIHNFVARTFELIAQFPPILHRVL